MKAIIQRISRGAVSVDGKTVGAVNQGYVVLLGVRQGDTAADAGFLADKTAGLRIFPDEQGKMNLSVVDIGGGVLVISQFTLYADTRKGNRPGFTDAAAPAEAERLYEVYVEHLRGIMGNDRVATGTFRATMSVELVNEGPVTIELSTDRG
jgi:D-tyrosyl-tRNA(Tyr) deacylase